MVDLSPRIACYRGGTDFWLNLDQHLTDGHISDRANACNQLGRIVLGNLQTLLRNNIRLNLRVIHG